MNKVILMGNLAADPEMRQTPSSTPCCTFRIAVQRRFANAQGVRETDFISCVAWRQNAEFVCRYFKKGSRMLLEGTIQSRSYDAQDGTKRYVTEVVVDNVEFASSRNDSGNAYRTDDVPLPSPPPAARKTEIPSGFAEVDDDELPF